MGRYYFGQIEGKFWVAVQDSNDPEYFGVPSRNIVNFHVCDCTCNFEDFIDQQIYCKECYDSYEKHLEEVSKQEAEEEEEEDLETWYVSESEIFFEFKKSDLPLVKYGIKKLNKKVGQYMESFTIIDDENSVKYNYDIPNDIKSDQLKLIARLCIGKQILYCLEKHGSCTFFGEV